MHASATQASAHEMSDDIAAHAEEAIVFAPTLPARPFGTPGASSRLIIGCMWLSLVLHAAAAGTLINWSSQELGAIEEETEAISLELSFSAVIEQADVLQTLENAGSLASVSSEAGAHAAEISEVLRAEEVVQVTPTLTEIAAQDSEAEVVIAGSATGDIAALQQPKVDREESTESRTPAPEARKEPIKTPARELDRRRAKPAPEGGAASRATSGEQRGSGRVSASTGNVLAYAARVRARVASNRPPGRGGKGRAVVAFGVTASGGLAFVSLRRSSGNGALDAAVIAAVRRASPFPPPPLGTPASRLTFAVPFEFR